uniref:Zinc finger protein 568-like n=1 Tax=Fundulus heteroclitus TaxID=8078 RepID=A0A3Q2P622_FUNHE
MEATSSPHAASLLAHLNHQRDQGVFCDCVLRQRQNPDQLYHAHRCILAASSPVFASILSSSCALVELHDPSLSDSVLPFLLDYIYTGVLPYPLSQQDYYSLLSAACHMQMKELQDALKATWLQSQVNAANDKNAPGMAEMYPFKGTENTHRTDFKTFKDPSSSPTRYYFQRLETASTQPLLNEEIFQEDHMNLVSIDPSTENGEKSIRERCANSNTRIDSAALNYLNTFSILESNDRGNASGYRRITFLKQQDSTSHTADKSDVQKISGVIQYRDVDEHHSPDFLKSDNRQRIPEEELLCASEDIKRGSPPSPSSPRPCCGAVPVIRHSSRAAALQQSEVSAEPPHNRASESSVQLLSKMAHFSPSVSPENDNTVEAFTTVCKDQNDVQNQEPRSTIRHSTCATVRTVNRDYNSNNVHLLKYNEHKQNGHQDSLQSQRKHLGECLAQNKVSLRGLKHQIESEFDSVPHKHQRLDCFECQRTLLTLATQEESNDQGAVVSLPMSAQDRGSDSQCEERLEVEVKGEHSYSCGWLALTDIEENHCTISGPAADWYHNIYKDEKGRNDDEYKVSSTQTKPKYTTSQSGPVNVTDSLSASKGCQVTASGKTSSPETMEVDWSSAAPVDSNLPGTTGRTGQPYHWHLLYQGEPHEDALQDFNHKLSEPSLSPDSDEMRDGVFTGSFAFSGQRSLSQYFPEETEDQLDVNTSHNEPPASGEHRSDKAEIQFVGMVTAAIDSHDDAQSNPGSSIGRAVSFDESADRHRNGKQENPFDIKGVWVAQNTGVIEASKTNEGKTKISTTPVSSPLSEADCDRASKPTAVSVGMPSTLASGPTDRPAHLSSPSHQPFHCSLCDRSFSQRGSLNRHVRSHLGVRPFPCPRCPMTFSRQYRVTEHMRVHQRCALENGLQKTPQSSVKNNEERLH